MSDYFKITRVRRKAYFDMQVTHFHPKYEIYYLIEGTSKMFLQDSIYILNKGDMVFIPMNYIHKTSYVNDKAHERIAITFGDMAIPDIKYEGSDISFRKMFTSRPVLHISKKKQRIC